MSTSSSNRYRRFLRRAWRRRSKALPRVNCVRACRTCGANCEERLSGLRVISSAPLGIMGTKRRSDVMWRSKERIQIIGFCTHVRWNCSDRIHRSLLRRGCHFGAWHSGCIAYGQCPQVCGIGSAWFVPSSRISAADIESGKPWQNSFAESLHALLRGEFMDGKVFLSVLNA